MTSSTTLPILNEGDRVPAFEAHASSGKMVQTKDWSEQIGPMVLYFYPRDNTPGCTQESCEFGQQHPEFEKLGITVFGISRDNLASHERFKKKYDFPFDLIADPDETLCGLFGVMVNKNMYGKKVRGIERSTFIIDRKGIIRKIWRKVKVDGHVDEVLAAVLGMAL